MDGYGVVLVRHSTSPWVGYVGGWEFPFSFSLVGFCGLLAGRFLCCLRCVLLLLLLFLLRCPCCRAKDVWRRLRVGRRTWPVVHHLVFLSIRFIGEYLVWFLVTLRPHLICGLACSMWFSRIRWLCAGGRLSCVVNRFRPGFGESI